jgi:hypothetical protein
MKRNEAPWVAGLQDRLLLAEEEATRALILARMVKLVDTRDLKSLASVKGAYRFDSGSGHQINYLW